MKRAGCEHSMGMDRTGCEYSRNKGRACASTVWEIKNRWENSTRMERAGSEHRTGMEPAGASTVGTWEEQVRAQYEQGTSRVGEM